MRQRFLVIYDYGSAGGGWLIYAHSREEVDAAYGLPNASYEICHEDIENHPYVRYCISNGETILSYDVENPKVPFLEDIDTGTREPFTWEGTT